ncbi:Detected protein of unknown function [Hibiscus syriacus]|uniref:Uncharacterized protein n=1 Tax=Hibiscus syriacus TaxID=106335 RepID=A0A6A2XLY0_HIBSY|nr:Detected protein of unknown function [Hibiscus syriacus]
MFKCTDEGSQGQHHSPYLDTSWHGLSNNLWVGGQRQVGGPLVSSLKNFSAHQLVDSDGGYGGQSSNQPHDMNFTQSGLKPEIARSQLQTQSPNANGYFLGHQALQTRQNETNFLGMDAVSRCLSPLDSQIGNGPNLQKKNSLRLETTQSPVNYDFFGGQQQITAQHSGMIQPLSRQQSGMNDMQLLQQQQHAMLKQMHELQRQQLLKSQFQLPETRPLSSANQVSSTVKQGFCSLSPAPINGLPLHDASNYSWQPEHMTPNANWLQHGASPAMHVSSGGFTFPPEQGQVSLMGSVPQQVDQSFYGISTGGARRNPYHHSPVQADKPSMQQVPASSNSFPVNQYAVTIDQVGLLDETLVSRQDDQGGNVFGAAAGQGLNIGFHSENLQEMTIQPKNEVMQESCGRQELRGPSEIFLDKSEIQAAPSQSVATLDETEEKILFGSDDSVWDIFGRSTNMGSLLDGTDSFGGLPSLQSGSWSALMQSAVAETSSNDLGVQEEWGGLGVQNSGSPNGNIPSQIVNDGSKNQLAWDDNKLQLASTSNSKPFPMSSDANINLDFFSIPGVQQSGVQIANEQTEKMHNYSSQKFVQQLTEERGKRLGCSPLQKPVAESVQFFGNVAHSPNVQVSAKNISGHQQDIAVHNMCVQPHNKPNGWNFIDSTSHRGDAISRSQDIGSQNNDHRSAIYEEKGHGSAIDHSISDANIERGNLNSSLRSLHVNRECSDLDNVAAVADSRTKKHNQDKNPKAFDSSGNDCLEKGAYDDEANMLDNHNVKETSNDSFHPNSFHHSSIGGMRDNVWMDVNDSRGGKQKSPVRISHKPSGIRKFQYHPMGDLDMEAEPSYGTKSVAHSQETSQHVSQGLKGHNQGYFGQSKFTSYSAREPIESEKGCFPSIHANEVPSKRLNQGSASDRYFVGSVPNNTTPVSQSMLELLPKFDQPREHGTATLVSSSEHNLSSEMPDTETSDGSVGQFQHNRPSTSQGFGLQLGLPSQRFIIPDRAISSQSSPQVVNSLNSVHVTSEVERKGHAWLDPKTSVQSSTYGTSSGDFRNNISSGSDFYLKGLQSQHVPSVSSQATSSASMNAPFGRLASLPKQTDDSSERAQTSQLRRKPAPRIPKTAADNNLASSETSRPSSSVQIHAGDPGQQYPVLEALPASQPSVTSETPKPGSFTKMPVGWTSVSAPHLLLAQSSQASQNLFNHQSNINSETTLPGTKKLDNQIAEAGDCNQSELPAGSAKPQSFVGEEPPAKDQHPNNTVNQNHSLLRQVQSMKDIEIEPSNRNVKRFKGPSLDSALNTHQVSSESAEQLSYGSDTMMKDAQVNCLSAPSNDILAFTQNDSQHISSADNSSGNLKGRLSEISPQMALSWFDRHGTFKNEQMSSPFDARKIAMKAAEKSVIVATPSESSHALHSSEQVIAAADVSQLDNACRNSKPISSKQISSQSLPPDITNQDSVVVKAKKRKSMAFELLPWHREVTQVSKKSHNISSAEVEWARVANRFIEKVEDEPEMIEDWTPVVRSRRRLILTGQLMQQLLRAPPRVFLSAGASKNYEALVYFVARSVLGDACSTAFVPESDTAVCSESESTFLEKLKERNQSTLNATEDFISRAKKLENYLQSLDKRASILDLRLECQDQEKVSVINRFARFHGRGQADGAETSSSYAIANSHKFFSQRYVVALPMPRNLPDRVQCLSL